MICHWKCNWRRDKRLAKGRASSVMKDGASFPKFRASSSIYRGRDHKSLMLGSFGSFLPHGQWGVGLTQQSPPTSTQTVCIGPVVIWTMYINTDLSYNRVTDLDTVLSDTMAPGGSAGHSNWNVLGCQCGHRWWPCPRAPLIFTGATDVNINHDCSRARNLDAAPSSCSI